MAEQLSEKYMECPICFELMTGSIIQCSAGHSMCKACTKFTICPICQSSMSQTRNYILEAIINEFKETLKVSCTYKDKGCKFLLKNEEKEEHVSECKYRTFECEGKKFAGWSCNWTGKYSEIYDHFNKDHQATLGYAAATGIALKINFNVDYKDVKIISFYNGSNYLYYKHYVNTNKGKVYWIFQLIGLKSQADHFYYEFEICDGVRKFKITDLCTSDTVDAKDVFKGGKCVSLSFKQIKTYVNKNGEVFLKYRIMSQKKPVRE